jgi:ribonuclease G
MDRELLVEGDSLQTRVAVVESGRLAELLIERRGRRGLVGNLYKGRVRRVLPGMRAAFVDLGLARDGYLWADDAVERAAERVSREATPAIDRVLRRGQDLIVQVTKDGLAGKGVRITTQITLPGRYLVLTPGSDRVGVSRRIEDTDERDRLRELVQAGGDEFVALPGCIVRTAAAGVAEEHVRAEYEALAAVWRGIEERTAATTAPALLHREDELDVRVVRDLFSADMGALLVDGADAYRRIAGYLGQVQPELLERLERARRGLFERYRIDDAVEAALRDRAPLPSGGYLVINQTEALVAIDVNTGRDVGSADFDETVLRTNLEAVAEAVRQIRLRDLSGIVVIDLIDMEREGHRETVFSRLEEELGKDRARHRVLDISEFGLVQLTRRRSHANLEKLLTRDCPTCGGAGRIKSVATICLELRRTCLARAGRGVRQLAVRVHPEVLEGLRGAESAVLDGLQGAFEAPVLVQADPELHREHFVVADVETGDGV